MTGAPTPGGSGLAGRGPILLVVVAAVLPRLPHVGAPIVGWHAWRQTDTAAIARNFHREGMNILRPAIDWAGATPGWVESEFPLFPFLVAGIYRALGPDEIWGRLLALLFSVGAALYLARLAARHVDRWSAALAAAAFSLFPVASYIGVAFMPESLMLLASVAAIDHLDLWSRTGRERHRWISAAFLATAIAVKLPELFLGVPVAYLFWRRTGPRMLARPGTWLYAAAALLPPALWYWHAHGLKEATGLTFGIWEAGTDKWGNPDLLASPSFYSKMLFSRIVERHLAFAGAALAVLGLVPLRRRRDLALFRWWLGGGVLYLLVVARGNEAHDYYQVPVLLPLSLWVGAGAAWSLRPGRGWARAGGRVLVAAFVVLALLRVPHFLRKETTAAAIVDVGRRVRAIVPEGSRIIALDDGDPTMLYHLDRKGWHASMDVLTVEWVEARRAEGATWLVSLADRFEDPGAAARLETLRARYPDESAQDDVVILRLTHTDGAT